MNFAEFLKSVRAERGLSQEQMGFELDVSTNTVFQVEAGQRFLRLDKCEKIADMFGYKIEIVKKEE